MRNLRNALPVTIALAAAGVALTAPQASAEIGSQVIIAGGGLSNGYGTGCTYAVTANSASTAGMDFYDNGAWFAATQGSPTPKTHVANWTPATPGTHILQIVQNGDTKTIPLTVGTGINGGSSCLVI
ncbi:hypothetical protein ACFVUS_07775 [Nocardia sp. NPDC058058]|uniref:hypothetical protein n=1 Tax=Nocardia sp. NPDC058058 TaxID=3346317 RepID=UPI0036DD7D0B